MGCTPVPVVGVLVIEVVRAAAGRPRRARGDPHRQRYAVRDVARQEPPFTRELEKRAHQADCGDAAAAADARENRAILGTPYGGVNASRDAVFIDLGDARQRIGLFIDHYNFSRAMHQGLDGLVPADRFFGAAEEVKRTLAGAGAGQRFGTGACGMCLPKRAVLPDPGRRYGRAGDPASMRRRERVVSSDETPTGDDKRVDLLPPPGAGESRQRRRLPSPKCCPQGELRPAFADEGFEEPPAPGCASSCWTRAWQTCARN